jgi:polyisoprenoid-binding protein YceI
MAAGCGTKDLDRDGDVDQSDFGVVQRCLSGSGVEAEIHCAE